MVTKTRKSGSRPRSKISTAKKAKQSTQKRIVVTATFTYGPFAKKTLAEAHRNRAQRIQHAIVSPVRKTAKGYFYMSQTHIGAKSEAQARKVYAMIKKHAPSAKITAKQY